MENAQVRHELSLARASLSWLDGEWSGKKNQRGRQGRYCSWIDDRIGSPSSSSSSAPSCCRCFVSYEHEEPRSQPLHHHHHRPPPYTSLCLCNIISYQVHVQCSAWQQSFSHLQFNSFIASRAMSSSYSSLKMSPLLLSGHMQNCRRFSAGNDATQPVSHRVVITLLVARRTKDIYARQSVILTWHSRITLLSAGERFINRDFVEENGSDGTGRTNHRDVIQETNTLSVAMVDIHSAGEHEMVKRTNIRIDWGGEWNKSCQQSLYSRLAGSVEECFITQF